ncbi:MAG: hypothetical protein ACREK4_24410, partial [Candidatus Rokuibacteriota bacterium]
YDRKRAGGLPSGVLEGPDAIHHEDIDLETKELGRQLGKLFGLSGRMPLLDDDIFAFHVAQIAKTLPEGSDPTSVAVDSLQGQIPDSMNLCRRLRFGSERRKREAENDREPNQPHAAGECSRNTL